MDQLDKNQKTTLEVLAYLFLRMNLWDKAERTYLTLLELTKNEKPNYNSLIALSSIYIEKKEYNKALQYINEALQFIPISSKNASAYLLKAKALWLENRYEEAKQAVEEFTYLISPKG